LKKLGFLTINLRRLFFLHIRKKTRQLREGTNQTRFVASIYKGLFIDSGFGVPKAGYLKWSLAWPSTG
jgi:hypothetical protein